MKNAGKNDTKETKNDMKRAKFIINEAASDKEILNYTESVVGCLMMNQIVNHVDVVYTNKAEDALKEAQKMVEGEYDFATAVGGDGTVHDVVNGVITGENHTPVAIIPGGTANDFANFLGLGGSKQSFCRMIKSFETIKMDAGKVNDRYFINSAGAGLGINSAFDTSMRSKAVLGKLAYALQSARSVSGRNMTSKARLKFTAKEFTGSMDTSVLMIRNAGSMAGGSSKNPIQTLTDGYLDVLALGTMDLLKSPGVLFKLRQGKMIDHPGIKYFRTKAVDIEKEDDRLFNLDFDKERFGPLPVHIECVPEAVQILVPKSRLEIIK